MRNRSDDDLEDSEEELEASDIDDLEDSKEELEASDDSEEELEGGHSEKKDWHAEGKRSPADIALGIERQNTNNQQHQLMLQARIQSPECVESVAKRKKITTFSEKDEDSLINQMSLLIMIDSPKEGVACHDMAVGLLQLLSGKDYKNIKYIGGPANESGNKALDAALKALESDEPKAIHIKVTTKPVPGKAGTGDGHSFVLVKDKDNCVTVYEGWAIGLDRHNAKAQTLEAVRLKQLVNPKLKVMNDGTGRLSCRTVKQAIVSIKSDDFDERDFGYGSLSVAYSTPGASFESREHGAKKNERMYHVAVVNCRPQKEIQKDLQEFTKTFNKAKIAIEQSTPAREDMRKQLEKIEKKQERKSKSNREM